MKNRTSVTPSGTLDESTPASQFTVGDITNYLQRLAMLQKDPATGNPRIAEGLRLLAEALRRHAHLNLTDLNKALSTPTRKAGKPIAKKPQAALPPDVDTLTLDQVERIISDSAYIKAQLIQVAALRFGIPKARLVRLNTSQVVQTIRAAVAHEHSLGVISKSARLGGQARSS
jgi:hypothetical protein